MDKVDRYRLTGRLGSGSFATVWKGHDDDLDVPVAVKVLADNWSDNEDVRNRFLGEARLMRKIRDERIVRVYDIGTLDDGRPYFVMDYADGGSLEDLRKQGIPPQLALRLCAEASRALHVLHINDVIHRDVTPGNVLLNRTKDNGVKVLIADLGVAKSMIDMSATMTAGTPAYMALEQANGVAQLDHRADIYSLAGVTYAMLTGRPPFPVKTLADVLSRDPHQRPAPIAAGIGAPPLLDQVLAAALSSQPGQRPRTALELAEALDRCADQLTAAPGGSPYARHPGASPHSVPGSGAPGSTTPASLVSTPTWQQNASAQHGGPGQHSGVGPQQPVGLQGTFAASPMPMATAAPHSNPPPAQPPAQPEERQGRPITFYIFLVVAALALFLVSLLGTIVALGG